VLLNGRPLTVIGIAEAKPREPMEAWVPLGVAAKVTMRIAQLGRPVQLVATARRVEEVEATQQGAERWLASRYGAEWKDKVDVGSNLERVKQATQTFQVFKILIAAITGVSLLVGGIGIMNVLLASVAERTREIGIRKAMGARNHDVMLQFLSESVAITSAGATVGVLLGFAIAFTAAWVMRLQTRAPVHAAVTPGTVLFAAFASIAVGLSFGLYPALRASRLSPIDAIRHE
jgi:putative ABC transport system permease protein